MAKTISNLSIGLTGDMGGFAKPLAQVPAGLSAS